MPALFFRKIESLILCNIERTDGRSAGEKRVRQPEWNGNKNQGSCNGAALLFFLTTKLVEESSEPEAAPAVNLVTTAVPRPL
jgi:hypothetical protein